MDILYLLDRLEEVVSSGRRLPLSSRVMIDSHECRDIVDQIRLALPEELKLARRVVAERDRILSEAGDRANQVVERAEEQAAQRIEDHALIQSAEEKAHALLDAAHGQAQEVRREADEYSQRVLVSLNNRLRQIEAVVQESIDDLNSEAKSAQP